MNGMMGKRIWLACVIALLAISCGVKEDERTARATASQGLGMDFDALVKPSSPNTYLIAPSEYDRAAIDEVSPVFDVSATDLARAWLSVIEAEPRVSVRAISDDRLRIEAEDKSAVFGFVDKISFRAIPLNSGRATMFAYSRSQVGYWDFGANKRRLDRWTDALEAKAATQTQD
jgi:uncharacterized protein (DUF1499 family)